MHHTFEALMGRLVEAGFGAVLSQTQIGVEKESLRLSADGKISQAPHPRCLGSALTHPFITTDYSEALIELITPPFARSADALAFLHDVHTYVYGCLDDEILLSSSMPCGLNGDASIPVARYGSSNIGRMKHVYRLGLGHRYGRAMQAIAGVHFNFSLPDGLWEPLTGLVCPDLRGDCVKTTGHFGLIRNVHRFGWLLLYLYGASPALSRSFFIGREELADAFEVLDADTLYKPYATSLRMSDIGYKNSNQAGLTISFDDLASYVESLTRAIRTPFPAYEAIGVKVDGEYRQLNANVLQIENEYYSTIRPKQIARSGERPTHALRDRGILYVELRSIDLNPIAPAGLAVDDMRMFELFLTYCALLPSPLMDADDFAEANRNFVTVAASGRQPGLTLQDGSRSVALSTWAEELIEGIDILAHILDDQHSGSDYRRAVEIAKQRIADPEQTPSARILAQLRADRVSFNDWALAMSRQHAEFFKSAQIGEPRRTEFQIAAADSIVEQLEIEANDKLDFDSFLAEYFADPNLEATVSTTVRQPTLIG